MRSPNDWSCNPSLEQSQGDPRELTSHARRPSPEGYGEEARNRLFAACRADQVLGPRPIRRPNVCVEIPRCKAARRANFDKPREVCRRVAGEVVIGSAGSGGAAKLHSAEDDPDNRGEMGSVELVQKAEGASLRAVAEAVLHTLTGPDV
jgi:hypothetical protein